MRVYVEIMTTATETELQAVQAAILAITTGNYSSISSSGKALTKLPLETLYKREAVLLNRQADEEGRQYSAVVRINHP